MMLATQTILQSKYENNISVKLIIKIKNNNVNLNKEAFNMKQKTVLNKEKLVDFKIDSSDIDNAITIKTTANTESDWLLNLINLTNECFVLASTTGSNGQWGKWFVIPRTCRTCNTNPQDCYENEKWQTILSTSCTSPAFSIRIATQPDENGNANGAEFTDITPNCKYGGGVITIY
ncbi:hypothetical protein [Citrobacter freundii]|uniref:hypothetical protein n=1 Tax=Citrobacter freundii TaxID=546 RepID=UPI001141FEDF|nr:hypothetical protein [Citrobacter freundii]MBJ9132993.1 hypothetical protein [Citrobacter freundii]